MHSSKDGNASLKNQLSNRNDLQRKAKKRVRVKVEAELNEIDSATGLPFAELLAMERIRDALVELGIEYRDRVYPPWLTLWAFLSQVTSKDASCKSTVTRVIAYRTLTGEKRCSPSGSSYSDARKRLPEEFYSKIARDLGQELASKAPSTWLWNGRHVKIVDGSTVTMPDTEANQEAYPQHSNQKRGLGFPVARITALFSLSVGTILDAEITGTKGKKTGEITAFRKLWRSLNDGDVVLGDCLYDGYGDIAQLREQNIDVLFGMSQSRRRDFRRGKQLGRGDHIVEWTRPKLDTSRMKRKTWETLPKKMQMREVTTTVKDANGKKRTVTVVTTLLDPKRYSKQDILSLFRDRWNCELDLRCVKTMMSMKHLSCKTPEMIRKEIWAYFMAYNLIRIHMARAADTYDVPPRRLSFDNARQNLQTFSLVALGLSSDKVNELYEETIYNIASQQVGNRPGRSEPRRLKRRKSKYPYLTKQRSSQTVVT